MSKLLFLLIFLLFVLPSQSQIKVSGRIIDSEAPVAGASVLVMHKGLVRQFTLTDESGNYEIDISRYGDSIHLQVSSLAHEPKSLSVRIADAKKPIKLNIRLSHRSTLLKEVIVKEKPALIQKQDTLEYDPERFKDGTEKVVEDILSKLPGVKVEPNGKILYKGKEIRKLLLDGEDVFESNYTIGSRNISADMIDKVQGIENFDENNLLKNLRESNDVAINLTLKKGKTDLSGTATTGYGHSGRYAAHTTGLLINQQIKGFGIASFNNVGQNNTPYDVNSDIISRDAERNRDLLAKTVIDEGHFNSILDDNFHRRNNNLYSSLNASQKVLQKSSLKTNLGFYKDRLTRYNESHSRITYQNQDLIYSETNNLDKKPTLIEGSLHFTNKERPDFHWDYLGKMSYRDIDYEDLSTNNEIRQNNAVFSGRRDFLQELHATLKISESSAVTATTFFSDSHNLQDLSVNPPTTIDNTAAISTEKQRARFGKTVSSAELSYLKKQGRFRFSLQSRLTHTHNTIDSRLSDELGNTPDPSFTNDVIYTLTDFNITPSLQFKTSRLSLKLEAGTAYNKARSEEASEILKKESIFMIPRLSLRHKSGKYGLITANYAYNQALPDQDRMFSGIIQTNYRNFVSNEVALRFIRGHSTSLGYHYSDSFNRTQFGMSISHNLRPGNYYPSNYINRDLTVTRSFFADISNKDYILSLSGERYVHLIRTTFLFNFSGILATDYNIVNNSEIRKIESKALFLDMTLRRSFTKFLFAENTTRFFSRHYHIAEQSSNNALQTMINQTKLVLKSGEKFTSNFVGNFVSPDLSSGTNYLFLDWEFSYKANKRLTYTLLAKNLTNIKTFTTHNVSDYSQTTNSHNLIERYIIARIAFGF